MNKYVDSMFLLILFPKTLLHLEINISEAFIRLFNSSSLRKKEKFEWKTDQKVVGWEVFAQAGQFLKKHSLAKMG